VPVLAVSVEKGVIVGEPTEAASLQLADSNPGLNRPVANLPPQLRRLALPLLA
jgi:hypothetical protein